MEKNIKIAYVLSFCKNAWFWLGIWVFFYLRFTDYAGIGILETILIVTLTFMEIPTGAIADLFGKKRTLILSFLFMAICNIVMGISPSFAILAFLVFIGALGLSLFSGTFEALVYDSLKQIHKDSEYDKKIANTNSLQLIAPAICGVIGGFMYTINPGLPFIATGAFYLIGFIAAFFLTEPRIDTDTFSFHRYLSQMKQGFHELTKTVDIRSQTILLLSIGAIVVIVDEMLNSFLAVEFGFSEKEMGILLAVIFLISALASQAIPVLRRWIGEQTALILTGVIIALTLIASPVMGLLIGGFSLILRSSFQAVYYGLSSVTINNSTESKYRATTLSTFNMIKNIPHVFSAYFVGLLANSYSAKNTGFILGMVLIILLLIQLLKQKGYFIFRSK